MNKAKYEAVKAKIRECRESGWSIKDMVAEVHNLWQEYLITDEQETELYAIANPFEEYNEPAEYWFADYGCLPIWEAAQ